MLRCAGVVLGPGDGTVPLISLGTTCYHHWHTKELNPHGVKVLLQPVDTAESSHHSQQTRAAGNRHTHAAGALLSTKHHKSTSQT